MFVDSHCHLTYEPMVSDIPNVLNLCANEKINHLLTIGTNYKTSLKSIEIANIYKNIYCTIGIHPSEVNDENYNFDLIKTLVNKSKKIIGIGETGLDFYYNKSDSKKQKENFYKHIKLANLHKLPVIVHTRNAEEETLKIITDEKKKIILLF